MTVNNSYIPKLSGILYDGFFKEPNTRFEVYICHVRHNNNIIKYTIVSANKFKIFWLHVSTALRPSSGQQIEIKCLQCAYNMGYPILYAH